MIFVTLIPWGLAKGELCEPMLKTSPANRGRLRLKTFHCKKNSIKSSRSWHVELYVYLSTDFARKPAQIADSP